MSIPQRKDGEPATVLVLGETTDLTDQYQRWLRSEYTVKVAIDHSTAIELFDEGVDVAFLDRRSPTGAGDDVLDWMCERGSECRIAIVTSNPPGPEIYDAEFDDYLCAPVTRREVHSAVQSLLTQEAYGEALTKLYSLASKKAALEADHETTELESCQRYSALVERIETLEEEISAMVDTFSTSQFHSESLWTQ